MFYWFLKQHCVDSQFADFNDSIALSDTIVGGSDSIASIDAITKTIVGGSNSIASSDAITKNI